MTRRWWPVYPPRPSRPFLSRIVLAILASAAFAYALSMLWPKPAWAACSTVQMHALAQEHSNDMARRNSLDHNGFDGRASRGARAENVAYGYKTEAETIAQWWRSPGHAANMRLHGCRAVASAVSQSGRRYFTMEIGE